MNIASAQFAFTLRTTIATSTFIMACAHLGTVRAVLPTAAVPHFQVVFAGESRIYAVQTHTQRGSPPLMPDGDCQLCDRVEGTRELDDAQSTLLFVELVGQDATTTAAAARSISRFVNELDPYIPWDNDPTNVCDDEDIYSVSSGYHPAPSRSSAAASSSRSHPRSRASSLRMPTDERKSLYGDHLDGDDENCYRLSQELIDAHLLGRHATHAAPTAPTSRGAVDPSDWQPTGSVLLGHD
jgi:hypothetical protein